MNIIMINMIVWKCLFNKHFQTIIAHMKSIGIKILQEMNFMKRNGENLLF